MAFWRCVHFRNIHEEKNYRHLERPTACCARSLSSVRDKKNQNIAKNSATAVRDTTSLLVLS